MRKPRDFDDELQALTDKAKALKTKKQSQLGELVISTGADAPSRPGALVSSVMDCPLFSDEAEKLPALSKIGQFVQFTLRDFSVRNSNSQMIAHLANDIHGDEKLFTSDAVVNSRLEQRLGIVAFQRVKRLV